MLNLSLTTERHPDSHSDRVVTFQHDGACCLTWAFLLKIHSIGLFYLLSAIMFLVASIELGLFYGGAKPSLFKAGLLWASAFRFHRIHYC